MSNERSGLVRSWRRPSFLRVFSGAWASSVAKVGAFALAGVLVFSAVVHDAEAKRMGGGSRSMGRQSNMVSQQSAAAPTRAPQPTQATPSAAPGTTAGAAQPARNRWMGPIAGLAAGLGIAALMSHFGLGGALAGAMANMLIIAAIAFVGIWLVRKFMRRREPSTPAYAGGASRGGAYGDASSSTSSSAPASMYSAPRIDASSGSSYAREASAVMGGGAAVPMATAATSAVAEPWGVPADFDRESFLHNAKVYFVRMQAAWDAADLKDIREFTTPEMFAEVRLDLASRGAADNVTDVVRVDAELLGIEEKESEHLASVRFTGAIREERNASAEPFTEVWNLSKRKGGEEGWLLAGIQQLS